LVGTDGWDACKQAWVGLAKLGTALAITSMPGVGPAFWSMPDKDLPSWLRESRTTAKEAGKALLAWDQWGSNPSRAAGAVTFNVLTTVFTGGEGAAAEGAGKAGAISKTLSVAGKVGKAIDPMTYVFKGAGFGISKVSDVMKGLKGITDFKMPSINLDKALSLPEGAVKLPDGTIHLPKDVAVPEGAIKTADGGIKLPEKTVELPPGTVKMEHNGRVEYLDHDGNIYDHNGNKVHSGSGAKAENVPGANDHPVKPDTAAPAPAKVRTPELVGVGARDGDKVIRLGSDISEPIHVPNHVPDDLLGKGHDLTPGGHAPEGPRNDLNAPHNGHDGTPATNGTPDHPTTGGHDGGSTGGHGGHDGGSTGGHGGHDSGSTGGHDGAPTGGHDGGSAGGHDNSGNGTHQGEQEITAERAKELMDKHVQLANNPEWFKQHYLETKAGVIKRLRVDAKVDGVELPQLAKDPTGKLVAVHDLPNAPKATTFGKKTLGLDTVPDGALEDLNKAAGDRRVSVDLTNAERALEKPGGDTAANHAELDRAQKAYDKRLPGVANNSEHSEKFGSQAAVKHVIPHEFRGAEPIELPKTGNGANMFDGAYELPNGEYLLVEEKAPKNDPDWRHGKADPDPLDELADGTLENGGAQGMRVQQGTRPYVRTILAEMTARGGTDAEIATKLRAALKAGKLKYVLVKANEDVKGTYAGATLEHFHI
ncbi:hypothetical protein ACWCXH_39390, partial [Kitasatospora sp. NPDC001660]